MEDAVFAVGYKQACLPLSLKILTLIGKTSPRNISDRWMTQRNEKRSLHRRSNSTDANFCATMPRSRSLVAYQESSPKKANQSKRRDELTWLEQQCEELNRKTEAYLRASQSTLNRAKVRPMLSIETENIGRIELDNSTVKSKIRPFVRSKRISKKRPLKKSSSQLNTKQKENVVLPPQYQRRLNKY